MPNDPDQIYVDITIWNRTRDEMIYQDSSIYYNLSLLMEELDAAHKAVERAMQS